MRAAPFTSPLEVSIYVEALRARPAFFVAALLVLHAAIWTLVAWLANPTPDPEISIGLALGREWQLGYAETPPLAPWLLEIAYRVGGTFAVYALGPATVALSGWLVYLLARRIAGDRHGALAVFLMAGVHPVAFPVGAFDSDLAQLPLVAFGVLAWWHAVVERNRYAWVVVGITFGLLSYAGVQGAFVLAALLLLTAVTKTGRASLAKNHDQIFALSGLFVLTLILTPRMIWLQNHGFAGVLQNYRLPSGDLARMDTLTVGATVILGHIGLFLLVALAARFFASDREIAPVFMRPALAPLGKLVTIVVALVPPFLALAAAFLVGGRYPAAAAASLVLYTGLLVVVLSGDALRMHRQRMVAVAGLTLLFLPPVMELAIAYASPFFGTTGRAANWPAAEAARYVTNVYRTRTGKPLEYIAGDDLTASAIALASSDRPHVFIDANSAVAPWAGREKIETQGGIVVWKIQGGNLGPPAVLAANLPPLVTESPLTLRWLRPGNLDFVRLGWAIIPPRAARQ